MKKLLTSCLMVPFLTGCSLLNVGPGNGSPLDWEKLGPTIQKRVKYVAGFAFTMKQVRPHKEQICEVAADISNMLGHYDDREASRDAVHAAIMNIVNSIEDENVRQATKVLVDMVLTEAFAYAWDRYADFMNNDRAQTVIMIARAVGRGLEDACDLSISSLGMKSSMARQHPIGYKSDKFTVSKGNK